MKNAAINPVAAETTNVVASFSICAPATPHPPSSRSSPYTPTSPNVPSTYTPMPMPAPLSPAPRVDVYSNTTSSVLLSRVSCSARCHPECCPRRPLPICISHSHPPPLSPSTIPYLAAPIHPYSHQRPFAHPLLYRPPPVWDFAAYGLSCIHVARLHLYRESRVP